jgi:GAF domain-containing protein
MADGPSVMLRPPPKHLSRLTRARRRGRGRSFAAAQHDERRRPDQWWSILLKFAVRTSIWSLPPIGSGGQLLGTLAVYQGRPDKAAEDDIALLQLIGQQLATTLDAPYLTFEHLFASLQVTMCVDRPNRQGCHLR